MTNLAIWRFGDLAISAFRELATFLGAALICLLVILVGGFVALIVILSIIDLFEGSTNDKEER